MQIGYIRNAKKPNKMVKMIAKMSAYYGNELVYFRPADINFKEKTISGKILIDNRWKTKEVNVPAFIDINPPIFKNKRAVQFLKEHSNLSMDRRVGSKHEINKQIIADGTYKDLIIPYIVSSEFRPFYKFLKMHKKIILKPVDGIQGKKIYQISCSKRKYIISSGNEEYTLSKRKLKKFYSQNIKQNKFLIQKYIHSRTLAGDPFDVRIRLEKNGKGNWSVATYLVRIGTSQKVVSNVAQGGSVNKLKPFLRANFPQQSERLEDRIKSLGKELPPKLEEIFDQDLIALGLDLAIEPDGTIYLFEVETNPGRTFGEGEVAMVKADYYHYVVKRMKGNSLKTGVS
uniref:YheC/YheD family protein n=1 Tax=uncultured Allobacillus sp. TaxID=1638025 RepID=UPI00259A341E|nr:YheC/YheD family protein [uncultured Allobacillus sp.]